MANIVKATVADRKVTVVTDHDPLTCGNVGRDFAKATFDDEWSGLTLYAVCACGGEAVAVPITAGTNFEIPHEVLVPGQLRFTFVGYDADGDEVLRTLHMRSGVKVSPSGQGMKAHDVDRTVDVVMQAEQRMDELEAALPGMTAATTAANTAASNANAKAALANTAATNANTATSNANAATSAANAATTAANSARDAANTAASAANTAASNATSTANSAASYARSTAQEAASSATATANSAATYARTTADTAAAAANTSASNADAKATLANTKAALADSAATRANTAAEYAEAVGAVRFPVFSFTAPDLYAELPSGSNYGFSISNDGILEVTLND